jgi:dihydrofolate synthase / folylpolyglutamate synthase
MSAFNKTLTEIFDLQEFAFKLDLDNINALVQFLSDPHKSYPVVHIAGTNGKGSTAFFLAKILQQHGLKVGLYTSPHLVDFRERIRVNDDLIEPDFISDFWTRIKTLVMERKATFFDTTTALALDYFRFRQVDVAVIETGLGGRLDSTNIVQPQLIVLTPIHFDHEKQLGQTLREIAAEKAGIIKNNAPVLSAEQEAEVLLALKSYISPNQTFYYKPDLIRTEIVKGSLEGGHFHLQDQHYHTRLEKLFTRQIGVFQIDNIALAYLAARMYLEIIKMDFSSDDFREVLKQNLWAGRLQLMRKDPHIFFDVSHNTQGFAKSLAALKALIGNRKLVLLVGLVKDKNVQAIARIIQEHSDRVVVTEPDTPRRLEGAILLQALQESGSQALFIKDPEKAFELCIQRLHPTDCLLAIGSHYLIGGLLNSKINLT